MAIKEENLWIYSQRATILLVLSLSVDRVAFHRTYLRLRHWIPEAVPCHVLKARLWQVNQFYYQYEQVQCKFKELMQQYEGVKNSFIFQDRCSNIAKSSLRSICIFIT